MGVTRVEWAKIEAEYVSGSMSYDALRKKHGVSLAMLTEHAKNGQWVKKRQEFRKKAAEKALKKNLNKKADQIAKIGSAAERLLNRVEKALDDQQQFNRHLVTMTLRDEDGTNVTTTEERVFSKADTKAMKDIAGTLKELTGIMRNVYGLPTQAEAEAQRIAAERLKMEQDKAKREEDQGKNQVLEVRFEEGLEELAE